MLEVAEADLELEAAFVHVKGALGMPEIARRLSSTANDRRSRGFAMAGVGRARRTELPP
jgi:hypothetical protein